MLTGSEMLRGSFSFLKECLIEIYGKLKFLVGNLVTIIIIAIYYILPSGAL